MKKVFLGIEIGGTKLQAVLGDAAGTIVARRRFDVDRASGAAGIRRQITAALNDLSKAARPSAVGVGYGGPVDRLAGKIQRSYHVAGWEGFALKAWLKKLAGVPAFIDNDANVGALGEALRGAGKGFNPVLYVTLGSGVGGGLVAGGAIYHGAPPGESEVGHIRLDRAGHTVESRCAGWAVDKKIRRHIKAHPESLLSRLAGKTNGGEAKFLARALRAGDAGARRILDETAEDLAFGLAHAVQLFHPQIILLGGGLSLVGEPLRAAVAAALPKFIMDVFLPGPRVALAALGEDAVPVGALLLAKLGIEKCL